jgi:hypothetical protein
MPASDTIAMILINRTFLMSVLLQRAAVTPPAALDPVARGRPDRARGALFNK